MKENEIKQLNKNIKDNQDLISNQDRDILNLKEINSALMKTCDEVQKDKDREQKQKMQKKGKEKKANNSKLK